MAFAEFGAYNPRFLLESVEGRERFARHSFIGFGKCLGVRLVALPRPARKATLLDALRESLAATPKPLPGMEGVPPAGGFVGYSSQDVVRYAPREDRRRYRGGHGRVSAHRA